jgi:MFS family permease
VRLQTVCLFAAVPGYFLLPLWRSWPAMAASLLGLSLINEAVRPANAVAITNLTTPEMRTRALALNRLAANLGFSFGPMIGGVLATIDFRLLFLVDGLTTLAAAALLLWFFGMRPIESHAQVSMAQHLRISPLRDKTFIVTLLLMLASVTVFFQLGSTYPLYLRDHYQMSKRLIGMMFAVNTTVIVVIEMLLIDAIKHWPPLRTIGWGCCLSCLGFGLLPFGSTALFAIAAMLVVTMGEMLSFPISAGFVANRSSRGNEGLYMGWYTLMFAAASVLGPAIGSAIYQWNREAVWMWSMGVGALVWIGFNVLASVVASTKSGAAPKKLAPQVPPPRESLAPPAQG